MHACTSLYLEHFELGASFRRAAFVVVLALALAARKALAGQEDWVFRVPRQPRAQFVLPAALRGHPPTRPHPHATKRRAKKQPTCL
jgi:hypothetical protein